MVQVRRERERGGVIVAGVVKCCMDCVQPPPAQGTERTALYKLGHRVCVDVVMCMCLLMGDWGRQGRQGRLVAQES